MKMNRVGEHSYLISSHDSENSCTLLQVNPTIGFFNKERVDTENHKVFSACLLNSNIPGMSMKPDENGAASDT